MGEVLKPIHMGVNNEHNLSVSEITNIILAITTGIYTVVTFFLWRETSKTSRLALAQAKQNTKRIHAQAITDIYKNFQSIFLAILENEESLEILAAERNTDKVEIRRRYLATFLINNSYEVYRQRKHKLVPNAIWDKFVIDIKGLYTWGFVKDRWGQIKHMYPKKFAHFIEEKILET